MSYDSSQDWQMQSPGWREQQIFKCLCTLKDNLASYFEGGGGSQPLVYRALLTQTGTDAPVATVLENTLGEVPTFTYNNTGLYYIATVSPILVLGKTFIRYSVGLPGSSDLSSDPYSYAYSHDNANQISFSVLRGSTFADDLLTNTSLEILIYP